MVEILINSLEFSHSFFFNLSYLLILLHCILNVCEHTCAIQTCRSQMIALNNHFSPATFKVGFLLVLILFWVLQDSYLLLCFHPIILKCWDYRCVTIHIFFKFGIHDWLRWTSFLKSVSSCRNGGVTTNLTQFPFEFHIQQKLLGPRNMKTCA